MKKIGKISFTTIIFFIVAFLFLAIGLGSLGSVRGTGKAYELRLKGSGDAVEPSVTFLLKNPSYVNDEGKTVTDYYIVRHVYLNVAVIYNDETEYAKINLGRGASESASSWTYEAFLANYNYVDKQQGVEENKRVTVIENAIGNWIEFDLSATSEDYLKVASYKYYKLTAASCNVLINEIVFVGEKLYKEDGTPSPTGEADGKLCVVPVEIHSAPILNDGDKPETEETAKARAGALIDRQYIPTLSQSSFFRYGREELASLMTVSEMRLGNEIYRTGSNNAAPVYHGDKVYNSLGTSILAFGAVIFGNSPFGLRFFPMLASFGVLVMGYLFVKALSKSEKAALVFAVLYALSNFFLGLGHFASPLMIGVFFYVCALYFAYQFYSRGIPKMDTKSILPIVLSGVFCAASVCVNGVYLIAALAVVGLFVAGMLRQYKARRIYLDEAIALAEEEEARGGAKPVAESVAPADEEGEPAPKPLSEGKQRVLDVVSEYRWKNTAAIAAFATALVVGGVLLSLLFLLPVNFAYVKLYDNPVSPKLNIFELMSRLFAGGYTGSNGGMSAYHPFYTLFTGTGSMYAVTAIVMNTVALLAGLLGVAYAVYKIVLVCMKKIEGKEARTALRRAIVGLGLTATGAILASFGGGALGFIAIVYIGLFMLAAECVKGVCETEWKGQKAAKICVWVGLGLLAFVFLLYAIVTFSIPLPALFMSKLF